MARRGGTHAVILAGGAGERFWPRSRQRLPKPFLDLGDGGETLLGATVRRARRVAGEAWVVCGPEHARPVTRITGIPARRLILEPRRRNTALAAGLAAERIAADDPEAVLVVLPADHRIPDAAAFARALRRAVAAARREDVLVTLGVRPTRPEPGYGYIQVGEPVDGGGGSSGKAGGAGRSGRAGRAGRSGGVARGGGAGGGLHRVRRFVEKPSVARARRYLRDGRFLWNAGIFVWRARTILEEIERHAPEVHRALAPVRRHPKGRGAEAARRRAYARAPSLPVDVAVIERSRRVQVLPVDFRWSDVGTWQSLAEELGVGVEAGRNGVLGGELVAHEATGNLVWADGRMVALVGVEDLAVVDTPDALLVARLDRSGAVRSVVQELRARRRGDLT